MPKVSVIIPIYNSGVYLDECILSVLNQGYSDVELILINDGSTDNSEIICSKYFDRCNVKYIAQTNQGVSIARQNGVNVASGEWIMFVDSDDTIPIDCIQKMISISYGVDIVAGATDRDKRHKRLPDYISSEDYLDLLFAENFGPSPVCKLFRHSLFSENTIKQFKRFGSGEDLLMNLSLAVSNKKNVRVCKDTIYNYRLNECSVTHFFNYTFDYCLSYFEAKQAIVYNYLSPHKKMIRNGLRQRVRFFYQVVKSSNFHNDPTHPFVKELLSDLTEYKRFAFFDRLTLVCTNHICLKVLYLYHRLCVRISGRLYF